MHIARSRAFRLIVIAGAALAAGSCSKDDIPTTPPGPFLFTDVAVSKFVTPPTTSVLHPNTPYVVGFRSTTRSTPTPTPRGACMQCTRTSRSLTRRTP